MLDSSELRERERERECCESQSGRYTSRGGADLSCCCANVCGWGQLENSGMQGVAGSLETSNIPVSFFILLTRMLLQCRHRNSFQGKEIGSKLLNTGIKVFQPDIENPQQAYPFH